MGTGHSPILFLTRAVRPDARETSIDGVTLCDFTDVPEAPRAWLQLREACFTTSRGRSWGEREFRREFLDQPWWEPSRMWFAVVPGEAGEPSVAGTLTLALRSTDPVRGAHLHWLLVDPQFRRRGLARALVERGADAAAAAGYSQIVAETLGSWAEAVACYERLGFRGLTQRR
jgi:ribosomal protein S18 acetylase RimI-like enzyme